MASIEEIIQSGRDRGLIPPEEESPEVEEKPSTPKRVGGIGVELLGAEKPPEDQKKKLRDTAARIEEAGKARGLGKGGSSPVTTGRGVIADTAVAIGAGFNVGLLSDFLGLPVDTMNAALGLVGLGSEKPVGGSQNLRETFADFGIGFRSIEEIPEKFRPFAQGGRVMGQAAPFAAAPLAAARLGAAGPQFARPILETARAQPGRFAAAEAASTGGAAIGRGVAESFAPGNELVGLGGEMAGALSPTVILSRAIIKSGNALSRLRQSFSKGARESSASEALKKGLTQEGESVQGIIQRLRQPDQVSGQKLTAAQKSDSPFLLGLQQSLLKDMPDLSNKVRKDIETTVRALNEAYQQAIGSGNPNLLKAIAEERQRLFSSVLEARLLAAERKATQAVQRIQPRGRPGAASKATRVVLEESLADARKVEGDLWNQIDQTVDVEPKGFRKAFDDVRAELLEEESLPAPIEAFAKRAGKETLSSGELLRARQRLLALQRKARGGANPDRDLARQLGNLADGILDDLSGMAGVDEARAFSRALNDNFTRGEVGDILGLEARGGPRTQPELTLGGVERGGEAGAVAGRQIEQAAQGENLRQIDPRVQQRTTVPQQEEIVRSMIEEVVDPQTGRVNAGALARFRRTNREILVEHPALDAAAADAVELEKKLQSTAKIFQRGKQIAQSRAQFARMAGFESPRKAVDGILKGAEPIKGYRDLARLAKRNGADAVSGLRQATFENLFDRARGGGDLISGVRMREILTDSQTGGVSLLDAMKRTGVLTKAQEGRLMTVIDAAESLDKSFAKGLRVDEILEGVSPLEDLIVRISGANIGGIGAVGQITGAPLVAAQAGSRFARTIVEKIPVARTREIIAKAIEDPALMAALLSKGKTPQEQLKVTRQINAFLLQTAILNREPEGQPR